MSVFMDFITYSVIILTILAFLFQFNKVARKGNASGISYISQTIVSVGAITWMLYGGAAKELAPALVNIVIMPPLLMTLYWSLKHNGVRSRITIALPILLFVLFIGALMFVIMCFTDVIDNKAFMEITALISIFIGGTFTAAGFMPQTFKTLKSKNVESLSLAMTACYSVAQTLWVVFFTLVFFDGLQEDAIVITTNVWAMVTAVIPMLVQFSLLYAILKWGKHK